MTRTSILAAATAAAALSSFSAYAGCADFRTSGELQLTPPISLPVTPGAHRMHAGNAADNIVGTWLVTYTVEGSYFAQAYIQWHSDGTEWEDINLPLKGGSVCAGSWTTVDAKHVARNHYGWLYTKGKVSGYFNETETDEVTKNGSYSGANEQKGYDLDGNLLFDVTGTSSAAIITP